MELATDLDEILANSYRDFHAKGLDYLCLRRSAELTVKAYFFEGDVAQAPEAVIPHDHRYAFNTLALAGEVVNHEWVIGSGVTRNTIPYERFDYLTPLNGGDGFTWRETVHLRTMGSYRYAAGDSYFMQADQIHTITVHPDTVLLLAQTEDVVPVGTPTSAFKCAGQREAPSLDGLYRRMDADHALKRLAQLRGLGAFQ